MDEKLHQLDLLVRDEGGVDCFFLGGLAVEGGMVPAAFAEGYRTRAGRSIRCFNFGMRGASLPTVAKLADILVRRHSVGLIVLGVTAESPREEMGQILDERATQEPWLRLQDGTFTTEGWLIEHSGAYREFLGIRRQFFYPLLSDARPQDVPDPANDQEAPRDERLQLAAQSLNALEKAIHALAPGRAVVVEMPLRTGFVASLPGGEADYQRDIATLAERVRLSGAPLWRARDFGVIPPEGWQNGLRLNRVGARLLSERLGARLADAVDQGLMPDPVRGRDATR